MGVSRYYILYKVYDGRECAVERRHADMRSCTDTASLSDYEHPLSIRERDGGCVTPTRIHRHGHGGAGARGVASRRHEVMRRMRRRYQNTNNRYQSANVAAGLSCQRHADMNVTDAATRVRRDWRHAVAMSNVDTEPLSEYEQPLPIRKRGGGPVVPVTRRHARHGRVGAVRVE